MSSGCLNPVCVCCREDFSLADGSADGTERQSIKDLDGNAPRPRIKSCSICDPFILIIREDDTIGLFIGELERGKIRRKDMSPMGEKVLRTSMTVYLLLIRGGQTSKYLAGYFYTDTSGLFQTYVKEDGAAETTVQGAMNAGTKSQWLVLVRPQGVVEVRAPRICTAL